MCNNHKTLPPGAALEHGEAHEKHHRLWSRRTFLRQVGLAGSMSMVLGKFPVTALSATPLGFALNNTESDRILVLIRLKGGNDGMNMIIPVFDYGTYLNRRPTIAVRQEQILNLSDAFGMPNWMESLMPMWQDGRMKIVHSVGYPDQNLSHFRSSDIWASASDADETESSGWLGRFLDQEFPDFLTNPPDSPPAVQIGGVGNLMFTNPDMVDMGVIVDNPEQLFEIAQTGQLYDPVNVPECYYGEQLAYMRTVANSTFRYAERIAEAYRAGKNDVEYEYQLGEQLALVARLIKGNLGTKFYMVELDGFDTHARQNEIHPFLLLQLANAVKAFFDDLQVGGWDEKVLGMTVSEFGRRIEQNASGGTDHGAAAPLVLFGPGLNGNGFAGTPPDLQHVDVVGNLKYATDFRQIYATVLENWLCIEGTAVNGVMGQNFERIPTLGLTCNPSTSTSFAELTPAIRHKAVYGQGRITIRYALPEAMPVQIQVFNLLGQPVANLFDGHQWAGEHEVGLPIREAWQYGGIYVYTIRAGGRRYSGKIRLVSGQ